jgi:peptide deformylase
MSLLKIARMGNPVLRKKAAPVSTKELASADTQRLIDDLIETMREYDGVGLAAPQVHASKQILVYEVSAEGKERIPLTILVNPQIVPDSQEGVEDWEGCLSIPDLRGRVPRYAAVRVRALDRKGKTIEFAARGFHARVIQHETDHLMGVLFVDRMRSLASLTFLDEYGRYWAKGGA